MIDTHYHRQIEVKCNYTDRTIEVYFRRFNNRGGLGSSRLYTLEEHEPSYNRLKDLILQHPRHAKQPCDFHEHVHGDCGDWTVYEIWSETKKERLSRF